MNRLHCLDQVGDGAAVLGFVGSPWTLATYIVEGATTRTYTKIKSMTHLQPELLKSILSHLANEIAEYVIFQVKAGAQCIQIFDSWGGQLPPHQWDQWSKPYIQQVSTWSLRMSCCFVILFWMSWQSSQSLRPSAQFWIDTVWKSLQAQHHQMPSFSSVDWYHLFWYHLGIYNEDLTIFWYF